MYNGYAPLFWLIIDTVTNISMINNALFNIYILSNIGYVWTMAGRLSGSILSIQDKLNKKSITSI